MTYYGSKALARNARTVRKNTLTIAEEIPEDKYAFRPAPDSSSVAQILSHITVSTRGNHEMHAVAKIKTMVGVDFAARVREREALEKQLHTKAQILDALRKDGEAWRRISTRSRNRSWPTRSRSHRGPSRPPRAASR